MRYALTEQRPTFEYMSIDQLRCCRLMGGFMQVTAVRCEVSQVPQLQYSSVPGGLMV